MSADHASENTLSGTLAREVHMRCKFLPGVVVCTMAAVAHAQSGSLGGTVVSATTHAPVDGALVTLAGTAFSAITSASGRFTIAGAPPGTFDVVVRRLGYASLRLTAVTIDVAGARALRIELRPAASDSMMSASFDPLVLEQVIATTAVPFSRDRIVSLPTLTLSSALGAGGGYLDLPRASSILAPSDAFRGLTSVATVRGGRPEATQYLLDGVSVNNPVFGKPGVYIEPFGSAGVTLLPGHADAEYGGAVAGVVDQAIRSGDERVNGGFEYQSNGLAGRLGDKPSRVGRSFLARGYVSGPVPFGANSLRFMVAGHLIGEDQRVSRIGDGEWIGRGYVADNQVLAKLTWDVRPRFQLSLAGLLRSRVAHDVDPAVRAGDSTALPNVNDAGHVLIAKATKRFSHGYASLTAAVNAGDRLTCSVWNGVCIADHIARIPVGEEIPIYVPPVETPYRESGQYFGGESYRSRVLRGDLLFHPSEHHEVQLGIYGVTHHIDYNDAIAYRWLQGQVLLTKETYRVRPFEFASYVEDVIQHDLVTVHLGARFDYGRTGGVAFVNPFDPNNGTTAWEVCEGKAPGINTTPFTYDSYTGMSACLNSPADEFARPALLDSAVNLARLDDMRRVPPRAAFSPRIGLAFPLTETSGMFLNVGRYSRPPVYHDAFRYTGLGSRAGFGLDDDDMCQSYRARAGTTECGPQTGLEARLHEFVGNPALTFEQAKIVEAGFTSRAGSEHSLAVSMYWNNESYLPQFRAVNVGRDIGVTYGLPFGGVYRTVVSGGSSALLGFNATLRRRRQGAFQYTLTYAWQRGTEIGNNPDLTAAWLSFNMPCTDNKERASPLNHPHSANGVVSWQWMDRPPLNFGALGRILLKNSRTTMTMSVASRSEQRGIDKIEDLQGRCGVLAHGTEGTGTLANLLYVRSLTTRGVRVALIARVQNLLNSDDGTGLPGWVPVVTNGPAVATRQLVAFRRIFTGMSVMF